MQTQKEQNQGKNQIEDSTNKQSDWLQEQAHFADCLKLIHQNISVYEAEYEEKHKETAELFKAMKSGDEELYNQAMTSASLEEHAANQLRKNRSALKQPYFGRIDYLEHANGKESKIYIGKNGIFRNQTDVVIADWRAPISSVYYENELGEGEYYLPDGTSAGILLHLKRSYDVQDGALKGFYDSDVASNDQLLVQYLSQNKEAVLGDIIATIQKEQNEIIRESPFSNILVQGVAGSGKTTVAMHRISYILYNYKERFLSNEFCIIGGNDLLLQYITSGLPELDVPDIKQKRMDVMLTHLLGKEWTKKQSVIEPAEDAKVRSKMEFMLELESYLLRMRERYAMGKPLKDSQLGVLVSAESKERLFIENPEFSIAKLLRILDERVKTRIKFLAPEGEKEYLQKKYRQYKDFYKNQTPAHSIYEIYRGFLEEYDRRHPGSINFSEHAERIVRNQYDVYDVAALLVIQYRITRKKEDEEFGQIFIDEAQDFGITPYYALRRVLPKCYFTIMGDVSQNINFETGMNDWYDMQKWILTGEKDVFKLLSKSYRNTIEISEYAGTILEKASFGRYKIDPVIRHGLPVQQYEELAEEAMYDKAAEIIAGARENGYQSIAVICKSEAEADWVKKWLEDVKVLPIRLTKGLEFDVVILWNPDLESAFKEQSSAKLWYVAVTRALHELYLLKQQA
uniref:HelD family protein n=1 Tax=Acetatifactor sp. TaxID=1872090 RepID=UPI00405666A0